MATLVARGARRELDTLCVPWALPSPDEPAGQVVEPEALKALERGGLLTGVAREYPLLTWITPQRDATADERWEVVELLLYNELARHLKYRVHNIRIVRAAGHLLELHVDVPQRSRYADPPVLVFIDPPQSWKRLVGWYYLAVEKYFDVYRGPVYGWTIDTARERWEHLRAYVLQEASRLLKLTYQELGLFLFHIESVLRDLAR